jgi:hypothetical protein
LKCPVRRVAEGNISAAVIFSSHHPYAATEADA